MSETNTVLGTPPAAPTGGEPAAPAAAPSTPPAAAPTGMVDDAGSFNAGWFNDDPGLASGAKTLERFAGPKDLAQSYLELSKLRPGPPGEGAAPETAEAFRKWTGVPNKYDLKAPEGQTFDDAVVGKFSEVVQKHNGLMTNGAMQELAETFNSTVAEMQQAQAAQAAQAGMAAVEALQTTHGRDWDNFLEGAQRAGANLGLDLNDPDIGNSAKVIDILGRISKGMSEGSFEGQGSAQPAWQGAGADAHNIMNDKSNPLHEAFYDSGHERHKEAHQRVDAALALQGRNLGKG